MVDVHRIYRAYVRNRAKLAYNNVAAWLEDGATMPAAVAALPGLDENLRLQDRVAQRMFELRRSHGGLELGNPRGQAGFRGRADSSTPSARIE